MMPRGGLQPAAWQTFTHIQVTVGTISRSPNRQHSLSGASLALQEPLMITQEGTIVAGYARVEMARQQGLLSLSCIEYALTEVEALHWLIDSHGQYMHWVRRLKPCLFNGPG